MNSRTFLGRISLVALIGLALGAAPGLALASPGAGQKAKISMAQARAIALQAYPGKIMKEELEHEGGGLRYSFDLRRGKQWREIGVDAMTGHIVENIREKAYPKD